MSVKNVSVSQTMTLQATLGVSHLFVQCRRLGKLDKHLPRSQRLRQGRLQRPLLRRRLHRALPSLASRYLQQGRRRPVHPCRQCQLQLSRRCPTPAFSCSSSSGMACVWVCVGGVGGAAFGFKFVRLDLCCGPALCNFTSFFFFFFFTGVTCYDRIFVIAWTAYTYPA